MGGTQHPPLSYRRSKTVGSAQAEMPHRRLLPCEHRGACPCQQLQHPFVLAVARASLPTCAESTGVANIAALATVCRWYGHSQPHTARVLWVKSMARSSCH